MAEIRRCECEFPEAEKRVLKSMETGPALRQTGYLDVSWDPSKRPRQPRIRINQRHVQPVERGREYFGSPEPKLSKEELTELAGLVPSTIPKDLLVHLLEAAVREHCHRRLMAELPRAHVRYQLRLLAHLVWRMRQRPEECAAVEKEFFGHYWKLDIVTKERLRKSVPEVRLSDVPPEYQLVTPKGINLGLVFDASLAADRAFKSRGDYKDIALHKTVAFLLWMYDTWSCSLPPFSKVPTGTASKSGTYRMTGKSPCLDFIYAFFERVDPQIRRASISSAVELRLREVRKRKRHGFPDCHDVANLFH
jgi:hypothetical protein